MGQGVVQMGMHLSERPCLHADDNVTFKDRVGLPHRQGFAAKAQRLLRRTLLLIMLPTGAFAQDVDCRVVGVKDGDTVVCLTPEKSQVTVRLAEIDAPESRQDFGNRAKQALSRMVFGKDVTVEIQDTDKYGRSVGLIKLNGENVNLALVDQGMAWCYRKYLKDTSCLTREAAAKAKSQGLWAAPYAPVPPWEFRHGAKPAAAPAPAPRETSLNTVSPRTSDLECGDKRVCRQMSSCAEAQFYLNQCGLARLDGDHDGVACDRNCQ